MTTKKPATKKKNTNRLDMSITKQCDVCGKEYHPRKNGYEAMSRFCSAACSRKRAKFF